MPAEKRMRCSNLRLSKSTMIIVIKLLTPNLIPRWRVPAISRSEMINQAPISKQSRQATWMGTKAKNQTWDIEIIQAEKIIKLIHRNCAKEMMIGLRNRIMIVRQHQSREPESRRKILIHPQILTAHTRMTTSLTTFSHSPKKKNPHCSGTASHPAPTSQTKYHNELNYSKIWSIFNHKSPICNPRTAYMRTTPNWRENRKKKTLELHIWRELARRRMRRSGSWRWSCLTKMRRSRGERRRRPRRRSDGCFSIVRRWSGRRSAGRGRMRSGGTRREWAGCCVTASSTTRATTKIRRSTSKSPSSKATCKNAKTRLWKPTPRGIAPKAAGSTRSNQSQWSQSEAATPRWSPIIHQYRKCIRESCSPDAIQAWTKGPTTTSATAIGTGQEATGRRPLEIRIDFQISN